MRGLRGKMAIITGAASGIGQTTAVRFAQEGANLALIDRENLHSTLNLLKKYQVQILTLKADVTNKKKIEKFFHSVFEKSKSIDILINNAGVYDRKNLYQIDEIYWDKILDNNLKSSFLCSQLAVPYMTKQNWGRIIFVSSVSPLVGGKSSLVYNVSKAGLFGLNRSLAACLAENNITVNTVMAGIVETRMIKTIPRKRLENLKENTLLKRFAKPYEISSLIAFLASEDSSYITGAIINISGGLVSL